MSQVNNIIQQPADDDSQPPERQDPNLLVAMSLYFPPMTPAFIGLCVVVLIAVFSKDFPNEFLFGGSVSSQGIIAALSALSAFLFIEAARMGYAAHANDLYEMNTEKRKSIFRGNDPFQELSVPEGVKNKNWFDWQLIVEKAEVITERYQLRAVSYLTLGLVTLFLSVSFLLASYILWLGIIALVFTCVYSGYQVKPLIGIIGRYRRFTKRLDKLNNTKPPIYR